MLPPARPQGTVRIMDPTPPSPQRLIKLARNGEIPFAALSAIATMRAMLKDWEWAAIESARAKGASWRDIAESLGITRQALQQRLAREHGHETDESEH